MMHLIFKPYVYVYHATSMQYVLAAVVATSDLEVAFADTNTGSTADGGHWRNNRGVLSTLASRRSTSVGDILERDGRLYLVEPTGFTVLRMTRLERIATSLHSVVGRVYKFIDRGNS